MNPTPSPPPVALTIAGSDNSAGAGAQADLKTFTAFGVYGLTALTCVVAEVPGRVSRIQAVDVEVVREQIALSLGAFPVAAIKTGMLYSRENIRLVAALYRALPTPRPPLVVDPVMVATSGDALLRADAISAYREELLPLAALVTPNLDEARVLLDGRAILDLDALEIAGVELARRYGVPFLMKGGHLAQQSWEQLSPKEEQAREAVDFLLSPQNPVVRFAAPFTPGVATHGTGCTYAAAVAAGLARGLELAEAVAGAKRFVTAAIAGFFRWQGADGRRVDALAHFAR
ncbi:MAG: bifunctional hydroxymethylpyrimidine kinase/phosphomethylpyrimidine kinase [Verrucomicrobia bacterium]|nr:bifunctional hydroxymethylpyrimidine kinase/phosphomethylpyrimidine kinase [Verrucomicrobiota bacterium]